MHPDGPDRWGGRQINGQREIVRQAGRKRELRRPQRLKFPRFPGKHIFWSDQIVTVQTVL